MTFDRLNFANILVDYAFSLSNKSMAAQRFKISNRNKISQNCLFNHDSQNTPKVTFFKVVGVIGVFGVIGVDEKSGPYNIYFGSHFVF